MLSPRKLQAFLLHGSIWSNRSSVARCRTFSQRGESMMASSAFSVEGITISFYIGFLAYSSYKHDCSLKQSLKWVWSLNDTEHMILSVAKGIKDFKLVSLPIIPLVVFWSLQIKNYYLKFLVLVTFAQLFYIKTCTILLGGK